MNYSGIVDIYTFILDIEENAFRSCSGYNLPSIYYICLGGI